MSKYIIEIPDDTRRIWIDVFGEGYCYTQAKSVDDLEELNSDYINEHFGELQDEAYERGYKDGKESTKNGCMGCKYEARTSCEEPCKYCSNCHTSKYTPMPKPSDRIEVGDEVINNTTGTKGILLEPETEDLLATVVVPNNRWNTFNISHTNLTKTGKHYDIASILEAMKS